MIYTVESIAKLTNQGKGLIWLHIKKGKLKATKINQKYFIDEKDALLYQAGHTFDNMGKRHRR